MFEDLDVCISEIESDRTSCHNDSGYGLNEYRAGCKQECGICEYNY